MMRGHIYTAGPQALISAAQDLTGAWADLGSEIKTSGFQHLGLWLNVDVNGSSDIRARILAKHAEAHADEFSLPIKTVGTSSVAIEDEYFELTDDVDQKILIGVDLDGIVPVVQIQVMAGTLGAPAGQIDAALVTMAY
jgi:hypothetical protein